METVIADSGLGNEEGHVRNGCNARAHHEVGEAAAEAHGVGAPQGRGPHARSGGTPDAGSAPASNTALANCTDEDGDTLVLRAGVDSLYLSYPGQLRSDRESQLEHLKALAQSRDTRDQAEAVIELTDHRFEVRDKGKGRFPFVLADNWFHLQVSRRHANSLPLVYAQVGSEILTRTGIMPSVIALNGVVMVLGESLEQPTVSRVDLCVDFTTSTDLESLPRNGWVTRADQFAQHHIRGRFSGFTFGLGGALSCRLYDKTLEIEKSGKTYFHPLWTEAGWDGKAKVWRLEFQYRRDVLRELGVRSTVELQRSLPGLWEYATTRWLRLAIPSTSDDTKSRWPDHPLWSCLSAASWGADRGEPLYRSRKTRLPSDRYLFVNGLGAITSFMARTGLRNVDEAIQAFTQEAHAYHRRQGRQTKPLTTYAREKAEAKARRFNTMLQREESGRGKKGRGKAGEGV